MDEIGDGLSLLAILGFVAFMIWHGNRDKIEKRRLRLEEQNLLLDRLAATGGLNEFLQTEQGQKFLDSFNEADKAATPQPHAYRGGVVGLLTAGLIGLPMSAGFFLVAGFVGLQLVIPGAIIGGASVGCLIAAAAQALLGRRWAAQNAGNTLGNPTRNRD